MAKPKVALVHDYLIQYGGAEKTLEAILELFPDAPIYTSFYKPENFPEIFKSRKIITSQSADKFFNFLPILSKYFTFLIPLIFENFDLSEYDLIVSDSSSYAKGVITTPNQLHISYIHTPPRFLYHYSVENTKRNAWYYKPVVSIVDHILKIWDYNAAQRPDYFVANSKEISKRIKKFYRRESTVIYPPVELSKKEPLNTKKLLKDPYYLITGRLAAYKNFDIAIKAFNLLPNLKLRVIGTGNEEVYLKKIAKGNIEFLGQVSDKEKFQLMQNCLGLVNPVKDEDFGIVPVEVISHGRPVLAHKSAGHLETVVEGVTGDYFEELDAGSLSQKIKEFDKSIRSGVFDPKVIYKSAEKFSKENFQKEFYGFAMQTWKKHNS